MKVEENAVSGYSILQFQNRTIQLLTVYQLRERHRLTNKK